jgi:hypothetical protein
MTQHMFLKALSQIQIIINNAEAIDMILSCIEAVQYSPNDYIIKQG